MMMCVLGKRILTPVAQHSSGGAGCPSPLRLKSPSKSRRNPKKALGWGEPSRDSQSQHSTSALAASQQPHGSPWGYGPSLSSLSRSDSDYTRKATSTTLPVSVACKQKSSGAPRAPPKIYVASATTQGGRSYQEDRCGWFKRSAEMPYEVFSMIDGHTGLLCLESPTVWDYTLEHLPQAIGARLDQVRAVGDDGSLACSSWVIREALERAYLELDNDILTQGVCGGAASVSCVLAGSKLIVSHVGDCRAILCRDGLPAFVTADHTPAVEAERERVVQSGGMVRMDSNIARVTLDDGGACGQSIMMTRSLGDAALKQVLSARPEVASMDLTERHKYLLLATDGVFENMDTAEVVRVLNDGIQTCQWTNQHGQDMANEMANGLIEVVEYKASKKWRIADNATAMVVLLDWGEDRN